MEKKELKKIIGFTCPEDEKTECELKKDTNDNYVCLDLRKEFRGEKYQVFVHLNTKAPDKCSMYCEDDFVTSYAAFNDSNCKETHSSFSEKCDWSKSIVTCVD